MRLAFQKLDSLVMSESAGRAATLTSERIDFGTKQVSRKFIRQHSCKAEIGSG
jgi:hypothetical protein